MLKTLSFIDKKAIIKKVVTKIVVTKQEVSIWERILLLATPNGETINNNGNSIFANYLENEERTELNVNYSDRRVAKCREIDII